jgi:dipeptide/tripeptide permease
MHKREDTDCVANSLPLTLCVSMAFIATFGEILQQGAGLGLMTAITHVASIVMSDVSISTASAAGSVVVVRLLTRRHVVSHPPEPFSNVTSVPWLSVR